jgi:hypothetical protein
MSQSLRPNENARFFVAARQISRPPSLGGSRSVRIHIGLTSDVRWRLETALKLSD